eukprot:scaffold130_cov124-Skeletonema_dohrnii-CCMP3373.AAC.2
MLKNHRQLDMIDKDEVEDHGVAVEAGAESTTHHRLGSARKPMSNIHGTNGFLVPLPSSGVNCCGYCSLPPAGTRKESIYVLFTVIIILMPSLPLRDSSSSSNRIVVMVLGRIHSY